MPQPGDVSRREFLAKTGAAVAAGSLVAKQGLGAPAGGSPAASSKLAIDGGPKAVKEAAAPLVRWGDAERAQLNATVDQNTMFYWQGPQTTLFTERFRKICPAKHVMTCSSGTA